MDNEVFMIICSWDMKLAYFGLFLRFSLKNASWWVTLPRRIVIRALKLTKKIHPFKCLWKMSEKCIISKPMSPMHEKGQKNVCFPNPCHLCMEEGRKYVFSMLPMHKKMLKKVSFINVTSAGKNVVTMHVFQVQVTIV